MYVYVYQKQKHRRQALHNVMSKKPAKQKPPRKAFSGSEIDWFLFSDFLEGGVIVATCGIVSQRVPTTLQNRSTFVFVVRELRRGKGLLSANIYAIT